MQVFRQRDRYIGSTFGALVIEDRIYKDATYASHVQIETELILDRFSELIMNLQY